MDIRDILSNNIVYFRIKLNMTQEKLSEKLKASTTYISELENGKRNISIDQLWRISQVFNIEPHELLIRREPVSIRRIKKHKS